MNNCIVVSCRTAEGSAGTYSALRTTGDAEAQINGGYYRGDSGAFNLSGTADINGEQATNTTHLDNEYCFAAAAEADAPTLYVKDENGFWIAVC